MRSVTTGTLFQTWQPYLVIVKKLTKLLTLTILCACVTALSGEGDFRKLYTYYFSPQHRQIYDKILFSSVPPSQYGPQARKLYFAFRGDSSAFHEFVHDPDRNASGEGGLVWVYDCVILLLRYGDDRFSELLAREDPKTREAVGIAIDTQIDWTKHHFPKTRTLYKYRYAGPSRKEIEQRERITVAVANKSLTQDDINRLDAALKSNPRFSNVLITSYGPGEATAITAPKRMPKQDLAELQRVLKRELRDNKSVTFPANQR